MTSWLGLDVEPMACTCKGGGIGVTTVANRIPNDPGQSNVCLQDYNEHVGNVMGVDPTVIGTDSSVGYRVEIRREMLGRSVLDPMPCLTL